MIVLASLFLLYPLNIYAAGSLWVRPIPGAVVVENITINDSNIFEILLRDYWNMSDGKIDYHNLTGTPICVDGEAMFTDGTDIFCITITDSVTVDYISGLGFFNTTKNLTDLGFVTVPGINRTDDDIRAVITNYTNGSGMFLDDFQFNISDNVALLDRTGQQFTGTNTFNNETFIGNVRITNQSDNGLWNGTLSVYANGSGSPNNLLYAVYGGTVSNGVVPHFWIQQGGDTQASGISRSFMIVNEAFTQQGTTNITSCVAYMNFANEELKIDCNTTTTGADLLVGDDLQIVDELWATDTDGEWHFMTRELELRDELTNNILFNTILSQISGNDLFINDSENKTLITNLAENNTDLGILNDTVALVLGTNAAPSTNFIGYQGVPPVLTIENVHPLGDHADVCRLSVGDSGQDIFWGVCGSERVDEFISRITHHLFSMGLLYTSGFNVTDSASDITIGNGSYQIVGDEITTNNGMTMSDGYYFIYSNGTYHQATSLDQITQYGDGQEFDNEANARIAVIWGVVLLPNTTSTRLVSLIQNKPLSEYNKVADCDAGNPIYLNFFPADNEMQKIFLPIAKTCVKVKNGEEAFEILPSTGLFFQDIRGTTKGAGGAPPSGGDNLGSHVAEQNLNMSGFNIVETDWVNATNINASESVTATNLSGAIAWNNLFSYPATCTASQYISALGDTLSCASIAILASQISDFDDSVRSVITNTTNSTGLLYDNFIYSIGPSYLLPQGCTNGQIAEYNTGTELWDCGNDDTGGAADWGGWKTDGTILYNNSATQVNISGTLIVANGTNITGNVNVSINVTAQNFRGALDTGTIHIVDDIDKEMIEGDVNTFVDIPGDTMTGNLNLEDAQLNISNGTSECRIWNNGSGICICSC